MFVSDHSAYARVCTDCIPHSLMEVVHVWCDLILLL